MTARRSGNADGCCSWRTSTQPTTTTISGRWRQLLTLQTRVWLAPAGTGVLSCCRAHEDARRFCAASAVEFQRPSLAAANAHFKCVSIKFSLSHSSVAYHPTIIWSYIYTVSTKKVTPCIHCHNSDKQCQILTEFWNNNAMSNCKHDTKFQ